MERSWKGCYAGGSDAYWFHADSGGLKVVLPGTVLKGFHWSQGLLLDCSSRGPGEACGFGAETCLAQSFAKFLSSGGLRSWGSALMEELWGLVAGLWTIGAMDSLRDSQTCMSSLPRSTCLQCKHTSCEEWWSGLPWKIVANGRCFFALNTMEFLDKTNTGRKHLLSMLAHQADMHRLLRQNNIIKQSHLFGSLAQEHFGKLQCTPNVTVVWSHYVVCHATNQIPSSSTLVN